MIDPATGLSLLKFGMGAIGFGQGANQGRPQQYNVSNIMDQYKQDFAPATNAYNKMGQYGTGLMDMDSSFNKRLQNQFSTMAADKMAQNNQYNTQNAARFGGLSGMANAQNTGSGVGFAQAGMNAFNNAYQGNMGLGMNALNNQAGGLMGIGQNVADTRGQLTTANTDMMNNYNTGMANNKMGLWGNMMYKGANSFLDGLG